MDLYKYEKQFEEDLLVADQQKNKRIKTELESDLLKIIEKIGYFEEVINKILPKANEKVFNNWLRGYGCLGYFFRQVEREGWETKDLSAFLILKKM